MGDIETENGIKVCDRCEKRTWVYIEVSEGEHICMACAADILINLYDDTIREQAAEETPGDYLVASGAIELFRKKVKGEE